MGKFRLTEAIASYTVISNLVLLAVVIKEGRMTLVFITLLNLAVYLGIGSFSVLHKCGGCLKNEAKLLKMKTGIRELFWKLKEEEKLELETLLEIEDTLDKLEVDDVQE